MYEPTHKKEIPYVDMVVVVVVGIAAAADLRLTRLQIIKHVALGPVFLCGRTNDPIPDCTAAA